MAPGSIQYVEVVPVVGIRVVMVFLMLFSLVAHCHEINTGLGFREGWV